MSPVPIYTPGWRETKWSKVPCLKCLSKQSDGRGVRDLTPGPPDPEFEVLSQVADSCTVAIYNNHRDGFIANCDRYYKVRWLLQIATVQPPWAAGLRVLQLLLKDEVYKYLLGNKHDATIHLKLNWAVFSFVRHSPIFLVGGSSLAFH